MGGCVVLPEVTLVGFAFNNIEYLDELYAAYCTFSPWFKCNSTIIFTNIVFDLQRYPELANAHLPTIGCLQNIRDYSTFVVKHLHKYYRTKHCLIFQNDGFPVNAAAWDASFLSYDYVGAKWWYKDGLNVGNGGFSLRSRALSEAAAILVPEGACHPEDSVVCRNYGEELKKIGFTFAPENVADRFSVECVGGYSGQFGFHSPRQFKSVLDWATGELISTDAVSREALLTYLQAQLGK